MPKRTGHPHKGGLMPKLSEKVKQMYQEQYNNIKKRFKELGKQGIKGLTRLDKLADEFELSSERIRNIIYNK